MDPPAARLLVAELGEDETPLYVYPSVTLSPSPDAPPLPENLGALWLAGTDARVMLLSESLGLLCTAERSQLTIEKIDGMVIDDCRVSGEWTLLDDSISQLSITVKGAVMTRYDSYFQALL